MDTQALYESPTFPRQPLSHQGRFTTKLVTFYRNGDKHFKGLMLPVNKRHFRLWETLLRYLAEKINLPYGVRYVYTLAGEQVIGISELMDGGAYVCASGHFAKNVPYTGNAERPWQNRNPGHGVRGTDVELYHSEPSRHRAELINHSKRGQEALVNSVPTNSVPTNSLHVKPRMVHIISNTHRASRASILLNPRTTQNFEQVLRDMTPSIVMSNPPVGQLYTWRTEEEVLSFTQLFRDFKKHNKFIACGAESLRRTTIAGVSDSSPEADFSDGRGRYMGNDVGDQSDGRSYTWPRKKMSKRMIGKNIGVASSLDVYNADDSTSPVSSMEDSPRTLPENPPRASGTTDRSYSLWKRPERSRRADPNATHQNEEPLEVEQVHTRYGNYRHAKPISKKTEQRHDQIRMKEALDSSGRTDDRVSDDGSIPGAREREGRGTLAAPVTVKIRGKTRQFVPTSTATDAWTNNRVGLAPKKRLKLQWVYGYRGFDHGNNLFVLPTGELLYYVGAVAVLYDKDANMQRHYTGHNEDIRRHALWRSMVNSIARQKAVLPKDYHVHTRSLYNTALVAHAYCRLDTKSLGFNAEVRRTGIAVHPSGTHVATGQIAGCLPEFTAHIRVWEVEQLHTHAILGLDFFTAGIACLSFSHKNRGTWLLAIEQGPKHVLSVWDWNNDELLAKSKVSIDDATTHTVETDAVVLGAFHPTDNIIVTAAGKQLLVWRLANQNIVRDKKSGKFDNQRPAYITCLEFSHTGDVLTGDSSGNISIWERDRENVFRPRHCIQQAHHHSVCALCLLEDGTLLSGGTLDRRLRAWNSLRGYTPANHAGQVLPDSAGEIRTIVPADPTDPDGPIILGTTRNQIMEGSLHGEFVYVLQGHCQRLCAVASHPTERVFATAGYDQRVMLWRAVSHRLIWWSDVERPCVSCTFNPPASVLAIGTTDGRFTVLNASDGMHVASVQAGSQPLHAMQFSPDGDFLALGSHDHQIYLYLVLDDGQVYRKAGILRGHSSFVKQIDWSLDGCYLQSVSGDYDLLFWDVTRMKKIKQDAVRDVTWKTQTCAVGYSVFGIWSGRERETEVTSVDRSRTGNLLAVGDNMGWLSLYRYPCASTKAVSYDVKSHSSQLAAVRFLPDDCYVISAGGVDNALVQWAVVGKVPKTNGSLE